MVKPTEVDDDTAVLLSHEIAREIEDQLEYPGPGEGDRDPRVAGDRGREVDARAAARRGPPSGRSAGRARTPRRSPRLRARGGVPLGALQRSAGTAGLRRVGISRAGGCRLPLRRPDRRRRPSGRRLVGGGHGDRRQRRDAGRHVAAAIRRRRPGRRAARRLDARPGRHELPDWAAAAEAEPRRQPSVSYGAS